MQTWGAISRREVEHNSPAFRSAGSRLGSFDYTKITTVAILSCPFYYRSSRISQVFKQTLFPYVMSVERL